MVQQTRPETGQPHQNKHEQGAVVQRTHFEHTLKQVTLDKTGMNRGLWSSEHTLKQVTHVKTGMNRGLWSSEHALKQVTLVKTGMNRGL